MKTSYQLLCDIEQAVKNDRFPDGKKPDASHAAIRIAMMSWPCSGCGYAAAQHTTWPGHKRTRNGTSSGSGGCESFEPVVGGRTVAPSGRTVASVVHESISDRGIRVFFPDSPIFEGLGTAKKITKSLESLVKHGVLEPRVRILSSTGHLCWESTREDFAKLLPFTCGECEEEIEDPEEHATEFYVSRRSV